LGVARDLAAQHRAKLSAFEAVSLSSYFFSGPVTYPDDMLEEMVTSAKERFAAIPDVEPHAAYGLPAVELALFSASVDLLVIGSRSYGPFGRLVHGSTAQQLTRRAGCPLLVLTRATRKADASLASKNAPEPHTVGASVS
jgi:nucleotide-binding universal stress UspA family protein